jgi:hypothetical protein
MLCLHFEKLHAEQIVIWHGDLKERDTYRNGHVCIVKSRPYEFSAIAGNVSVLVRMSAFQ